VRALSSINHGIILSKVLGFSSPNEFYFYFFIWIGEGRGRRGSFGGDIIIITKSIVFSRAPIKNKK
jgi:hypothetical protein